MSDDVITITCVNCQGAGIIIHGNDNVRCYPCYGRGTVYRLAEDFSAEELADIAAERAAEEEIE